VLRGVHVSVQSLGISDGGYFVPQLLSRNFPYGATSSYAMIFHFWFSFPHSNVSAAG
jgi:hypothetical protein